MSQHIAIQHDAWKKTPKVHLRYAMHSWARFTPSALHIWSSPQETKLNQTDVYTRPRLIPAHVPTSRSLTHTQISSQEDKLKRAQRHIYTTTRHKVRHIIVAHLLSRWVPAFTCASIQAKGTNGYNKLRGKAVYSHSAPNPQVNRLTHASKPSGRRSHIQAMIETHPHTPNNC